MEQADVNAKINLALVVGPRGEDGFHQVATILQRIDLCDRISLELGSRLEVAGFEGDTLVRAALDRLASRTGIEPRWRVLLEKGIPLAAGLGGGSADAAAALVLANRTLPRPLPPDELREVALEVGSDVPFFLAPGPKLAEGRGELLTVLELPQDYWVLVAIAPGVTKPSTGEIYRRFDDLGGGAGFEERRARLLEALSSCRQARDLDAFPPNDLAEAAGGSALPSLLRAHGAFRADLSGAGPAVYGLFDGRDQAEVAMTKLPSGFTTWLVAPVW